MQKATGENYKEIKNGKYFLSPKGIEGLCENCFKQKYLNILEQYKMKLTELYIQAGYPYDNFFRKNLKWADKLENVRYTMYVID